MREFLAVCFGFFGVLLTWPVLSIPNRPLHLAGVPSLALYLFTNNRRYLSFAWRVFQFAFVFLLVFLALYVIERLVLVI